MPDRIAISNSPSAEDLWKGIAGHFDSFDQILCEFIDNSVSNFVGNRSLAKSVIIRVREQQNGTVVVSIEDSGTGIKDLDAAFSIGSTAGAESPLNEHGFGMKHALASANPSNTEWEIFTRTKHDYDSGVFKKIEARYKIHDFAGSLVKIGEENWPGDLNGSGTFVRFQTSREMLNTLRAGIPGPAFGFEKLVDILREDLGFIYAGVIKANNATIVIRANSKNGDAIDRDVSALEPHWLQYYQPGHGAEPVDFGGGNVRTEYAFGEIAKQENYKYYKRNMSSSGLEIRLNGRVLDYNLFKEVWGLERHNMYNHLLVTVNLISDLRQALPPTRTSKNGLREGDPRLERLYQWVREMMPNPPKELPNAYRERDLFAVLADHKRTHVPDPKAVELEMNVYRNISAKIPVDLYVHHSSDVIVYEGKKDETSVQDVYQLKMYWDGCVLDGMQPTKGILIAARHPQPVTDLIARVNAMTDIGGSPYRVETKTWKEEGVNYP